MRSKILLHLRLEVEKDEIGKHIAFTCEDSNLVGEREKPQESQEQWPVSLMTAVGIKPNFEEDMTQKLDPQ
ncbi:unnamed protein product [Dovyalis caffra]|uniref:Uncharacterized protein n=1 Tax=Dovyalis caffra TaxID=77055 RepID=A0AAV1SM63_9ROSI|nr:unnamed protein product [Dovyalis caffra]